MKRLTKAQLRRRGNIPKRPLPPMWPDHPVGCELPTEFKAKVIAEMIESRNAFWDEIIGTAKRSGPPRKIR